MPRFHGVFSLLLIFISVAAGFIAVSSTSALLAGIYAIIALLSSMGIVYFYCSKCACSEYACGHVLPGKLVQFFPERKSKNYSGSDFFATGTAIALIIGFPQYWLWKYTPLFAVFWVLMIIALAEILLCVCNHCENSLCLIRKNASAGDQC